MEEKRVEDAHSLLVRMFTFSADFDLVSDRKRVTSHFIGCGISSKKYVNKFHQEQPGKSLK